MNCFCRASAAQRVVPVVPIVEETLQQWMTTQESAVVHSIQASVFEAKPGSFCRIFDAQGCLSQVLLGVASADDFWSFGALPPHLPSGDYVIQAPMDHHAQYLMAWGLGCYQFNRYKQQSKSIDCRCVVPDAIDILDCQRMVEAICWVRDLINLPADDLGPSEYSQHIADFAQAVGAEWTEVVGNALLENNYPMIHAVGRASDDPPRLVQLRWGKKNHPKIVLVGKGVCFDSGGLNIKTGEGMRQMKKDMGGSAQVLGLAKLMIESQMPVQLVVLLPLVENAISGGAVRPGDVLRSRKGLSVEIGNTDAEGRLILGDALHAACEEQPDLIVDFATLTGAARVALGTQLPAFFTHDEALAADLMSASARVGDPIWRLPLYQPYKTLLKSTVADMSNVSSSSYGGAITAALFLEAFVGKDVPWVHFDIMAANVRGAPGRPEGGEAMGIRAVFDYCVQRFCACSSVG